MSWSDNELNHAFGTQTPTPPLPAMGPPLAEAIADQRSLSPRRPLRRLTLFAIAALSQTLALTVLTGFRRDLDALPRVWLFAYIGAWVLGFAVLAWGTQVPPRGQVMARARLFGLLGVAAGAVFMVAGLIFARSVPGLSTLYEPTLSNVIHYAPYCLMIGTATAIGPIILAGLFVRGAAPRGARWLGAGVGASAGSLGGLILHFHCPIAEATHLGLVHGVVVALATLIGFALVPVLSKTR